MKTVAVFSVCVFVACLFVDGQADCPSYPDPSKGTEKTGTEVVHQCAVFVCEENGSWTSKGCGVWTCEDEIGYQDYDYSKPYPECCPRPICKSDQVQA